MRQIESQKKAILNYLLTGCKMTGLEALKICGCIKASNRISELIEEGFDIQKQMIKIKTKFGEKRVAQYYLPSKLLRK
jgi:hypothetical protein